MSITGVELRFHPDEQDYPVMYEGGAGEPQRPCFLSHGTQRLDGVDYPAEFYQFYFRRNLAIGLGGVFPSFERLGYHEHDVEGLVVVYNVEKTEPILVYFKAHGLGQGVWKTWEECRKNRDNKVIAYCALYSHAMYPEDEDVTRIFGFANDRVSSHGRRLRFGEPNIVEAKAIEFEDGIRIIDTIPFIAPESISDHERIALPFFNRDIRERAKEQAQR